MKCRAIQGENTKDEIAEINLALVTFVKPMMFSGTENAEINHDKAFANLNFIIQKETGKDAKEMTVFELYSTLQLIKTQYKNARKSAKNK